MKKIKISYILLAITIILNLFLINKTMELSNFINSNSSMISELNSTLNTVQYKIESLPTELSKESSFVSSVNTTLLSSASTDDTYTLSFEVYFKELQNGEIPFIIYTSEDNTTNWSKIPLNETSTLCYVAELNLNYSSNYQYRVITEGTNSQANYIENLISTDYYPLQVDAYDMPNASNSESTSIAIDVSNTYELADFEPVNVYVKIENYDKEFSADASMDVNSKNTNTTHYTSSISAKDIPSDFRGSIPISIYVTCKNGSTFSFKNVCRVVVIY